MPGKLGRVYNGLQSFPPVKLLLNATVSAMRTSSLLFHCLIVNVLCLPGSLWGDDFPQPKSSPSEAHLKPMEAREAADKMNLPDGFRVSVFAAEPDVQNPIAMAWDQRGRMWVAENYTYSDRAQRFDLSLRDRVLIFEDKDGDGRADARKVFTDNVQMLTSVEVGRGGVWLMCPPQLLFIPDANQDDVADGPTKVVLDGFDVAQDNYHNFANGLRWGPMAGSMVVAATLVQVAWEYREHPPTSVSLSMEASGATHQTPEFSKPFVTAPQTLGGMTGMRMANSSLSIPSSAICGT